MERNRYLISACRQGKDPTAPDRTRDAKADVRHTFLRIEQHGSREVPLINSEVSGRQNISAGVCSKRLAGRAQT